MVAEQERKEKEEAARKKAEEEAARAAARVASTNSSVEATSVTLVSQSTGKALGRMAPARNHTAKYSELILVRRDSPLRLVRDGFQAVAAVFAKA